MAPKRAKFYTYGNSQWCHDVRKFIEDSGIILDVRDIEKHPLSVDELGRLFGHCDITHFVDPMSKAYHKHGLDKAFPERDKILDLMAQDHTLIRQPIIQCARLMTVGCDKTKISEMLLLGRSGAVENGDSRRNRQNRRHEAVSAGK